MPVRVGLAIDPTSSQNRSSFYRNGRMIDPGIEGFAAFFCALLVAFLTASFFARSTPNHQVDPARFGCIDGLRGS